MKNRSEDLLLVFIILCIGGAVLLSGCTSPEIPSTGSNNQSMPQPANDTIRIGAIYNLEGSEATFDVPSMQGARLAVKEINDEGGIRGKPLELVLVNGRSNTDTVVAGASDLAKSGTVPIIIGLSNPDHALPAAKAAASQKVFFVTSGATSPRLPIQVPVYLYLACMGDNTQAATGAEYAAGTLNATNAYIITQSDRQYPTLLAGYFITRFSELNRTVLKTDTFQSEDTNFSSQMTNLSALSPQPDMIFLSTQTWADAKPIIHEIRKAGFSMPVMGGDGYDSPTLLTGDAADIDNVYFTTHTWFDPATTNKKQHDFMTRYQEEYNTSAVPFAGLGYDTVKIVAEAIRNSESPAAFSEGMSTITTFTGVTGNLSYQDNTHIPVKSVTLMKIQNGTLKYVGKFRPVKVPSP